MKQTYVYYTIRHPEDIMNDTKNILAVNILVNFDVEPVPMVILDP